MQNAEKLDFAATAAQMVKLLPGTWKVKHVESWYFSLVRADGATLWVNGSHDRTKWVVSTDVPDTLKRHVPYDTPRNTCGIGKQKDFQQMAKDIERRLLPALDALMVVVTQRAAESAERWTALCAVAEQFMQAAPFLRRKDNEENESISFSYYLEGRGYGDLRLSSAPPSVRLEANNVSPTQMLALLRLL